MEIPGKGGKLKENLDRRAFLRIAGISIGVGALYKVAPLAGATPGAAEVLRQIGRTSGETVKPFSFIQMSDTHVGFAGPPNPLGTQAFERAVDLINSLPEPPDLVLVTGDLTQDSEDRGVHASRMQTFQEIAGRLKVKQIHVVPGEHDAGLDGGELFRSVFGETSYSFDHRGIHFIALDNVSQGKPEVGAAQQAWLKKDLSRFSRATPIVVFTHRPLFDLKPEWEWYTDDGDEVMNILSPYENVTVLYGHIHRQNIHRSGAATHFAARSLIFAFPDPAPGVAKKPIPFDRNQPFKNLGIRRVAESGSGNPGIDDVELTAREFAGTSGIQQLLKGRLLA